MGFLYNVFLSQEGKDKPSSKLEIASICLTILAGVDGLVFPRITGGKSLHQCLGLNLQHEAEVALRIGEFVAAYGGLAYQWYRSRKAK